MFTSKGKIIELDVERYIKKSQPRLCPSGSSKVNHFELISHIIAKNKDYSSRIKMLCTVEKENDIIKMLKKEVFIYFSEKRAALVEYTLKKRFHIIRGIFDGK